MVALGCVIRGETGHYDIVAGESSRALMDLSVARRIPLGNGILTVENDAQAWARARVGEMNKGGGAAEAALAVLRIKRRVRGRSESWQSPPSARAARLAAVQALYQMDVSGKGVIDALAEFEAHWIGREVEGIAFQPADSGFFRDILEAWSRSSAPSTARSTRLSPQGWPLKRIEAVLRAILRAGAYELMFRKDVPARVVISEYVDVTHGFYDEDEPGLVNAILDAHRPRRPRRRTRQAGEAARTRGKARSDRFAMVTAPSEDDLIARYFAPLAGEGALGLRDDAACLSPRPGHDLVLTTDAFVEWRAFPSRGPCRLHRAARRSA